MTIISTPNAFPHSIALSYAHCELWIGCEIPRMRWIGESFISMACFMRPSVTAESIPPETETLHLRPFCSILHGCIQAALLHVIVEQRALQLDPLGSIKRSLSLLRHPHQRCLHDRFPEPVSRVLSSRRIHYKRRFGFHVSFVADNDLHPNPIEGDRRRDGGGWKPF